MGSRGIHPSQRSWEYHDTHYAYFNKYHGLSVLPDDPSIRFSPPSPPPPTPKESPANNHPGAHDTLILY